MDVNDGNHCNFRYDRTFAVNSNQHDVFEQSDINYLIKRALLGDNVTICCVGQKASGKTHTLNGGIYAQSEFEKPEKVEFSYFNKAATSSNSGLSVKIIQELYSQLHHVSKERQVFYKIYLSYFNISNGSTKEMVDLLKPEVGNRTKHKIYKDSKEEEDKALEF